MYRVREYFYNKLWAMYYLTLIFELNSDIVWFAVLNKSY